MTPRTTKQLPIDASKGWADTPADSLTQSLADDVTASIKSERRALNNNKTADWYKAVLMNPRPTVLYLRLYGRVDRVQGTSVTFGMHCL